MLFPSKFTVQNTSIIRLITNRWNQAQITCARQEITPSQLIPISPLCPSTQAPFKQRIKLNKSADNRASKCRHERELIKQLFRNSEQIVRPRFAQLSHKGINTFMIDFGLWNSQLSSVDNAIWWNAQSILLCDGFVTGSLFGKHLVLHYSIL